MERENGMKNAVVKYKIQSLKGKLIELEFYVDYTS